MSFSSFDSKLSLWKRLLVGFAEEMELDNSGRILVSLSQRQFAGLEKKVMLVGQGSHFELWSESSWEKQISQFDEGPANPPP
jgi:MraZ protein